MRTTLGRLAHLLVVLLGISMCTFALFALAPGDPAEIILRDRHEAPMPEQVEALRREMGLDDPLAVRYLRWLGRVCRGDLGRSWRTGELALQEVWARLPATAELALGSFALLLFLSTTSGAIGALRRGRFPDMAVKTWTILSLSLPNYWLGLLLIYFLALKMHWFPVMGRGGISHLVLPAITLCLAVAALQGRVLRATLIQVQEQDYIRFAFAKGLGSWAVFSRHMIKNALPPLVTMWAVSLGQLMGGAVIVESIFAWPGLGQLTVQSVLSRDVPVVQAIVLLVSVIFVVVNQLADVAHRRLDPRVGNRPR